MSANQSPVSATSPISPTFSYSSVASTNSSPAVSPYSSMTNLYPGSQDRSCKQPVVEAAHPPELCGRLFKSHASVSDNTALGRFCRLHRTCFGLNGNERCTITRLPKQNGTFPRFCDYHRAQQPCKTYKAYYKHICAGAEDCAEYSSPQANQERKNKHLLCADKREQFSSICVHPEAHDAGHRQAVYFSRGKANHCDSFLPQPSTGGRKVRTMSRSKSRRRKMKRSSVRRSGRRTHSRQRRYSCIRS